MSAARFFTMAALTAVLAIRKHLSANPSVSVDAAVTAITRTDADFANSDFSTGLELHTMLPQEVTFDDPAAGFREAISFLILRFDPSWVRAFRLGRRHVANELGRDELQCFRSAELMMEPPTDEVVQWWDRIKQTIYAALNDTLLVQGRSAERMSFDRECARVKSLGIKLEPKWVGFDDDTVGFDIQSYDGNAEHPRSRLIEVKSSTANPPVFVISRKQWETALKLKDAYLFHLWNLKNGQCFERTVQHLMPHIPGDQGEGAWKTVDIPLKSLRE